MEPVIFICSLLTVTLIVAFILIVRQLGRELRNESLPLAARPSVTLNGIDFAINSLDHETFQERDAVYVILGAGPDASFEIIDAGETPELGSKPMNTPERKASWLRRNSDIWVGVYLLNSDVDTRKDRNAIIRGLLN